LVVVHGGAVDSPAQLVNDARRKGVRQLDNIIGGTDGRGCTSTGWGNP
jgi:hypothetical protein